MVNKVIYYINIFLNYINILNNPITGLLHDKKSNKLVN